MNLEERNFLVKESLRSDFKKGTISFFLGAGISRPFGIPDWSNLLQRIVESIHPENEIRGHLIKNNANPLILARYIRSKFPSKENFNLLVHQNLYEKYIDKSDDYTLRALTKYAERTVAMGKDVRLITYNFDCVVEKFISDHAIGLSVKSSDLTYNRSNHTHVDVFHCHGRLPFEASEAINSQIIFDENEYHSAYYDQYNWSNMRQMGMLMEMNCVFLGISLTDPNMRRLIDFASKQRAGESPHYIFRRVPDTYFSATHADEIAISEQIMAIFEADALSLGCRTIWIKDFSDISTTILFAIS